MFHLFRLERYGACYINGRTCKQNLHQILRTRKSVLILEYKNFSNTGQNGDNFYQENKAVWRIRQVS